jgi:uncharacterized protein (UPF0305 family)
MIKKFNKLKKKKEISKNDVKNILQKMSKEISVHDIISATLILREEGKYIQGQYKEKYLEVYIKYFVMRIKYINEDMKNYKGYINKKEFFDSLNLLNAQINEELLEDYDKSFSLIYSIVSLYTTYILDEPIHPVGTPFPGNFKVILEEDTYYCPVKENNKNNPKAVCKFCIAEQLKL